MSALSTRQGACLWVLGRRSDLRGGVGNGAGVRTRLPSAIFCCTILAAFIVRVCVVDEVCGENRGQNRCVLLLLDIRISSRTRRLTAPANGSSFLSCVIL